MSQDTYVRLLKILLILTLVCSVATAGEVIVGLDRLAFITPPPQDADEYSSRIALHFSLPDEISGSDVIYAELQIPLDFSNIQIEGALILEFQAHNITSDWTEQNADWDSPWTEPGGDIDTLTFYTYTITMDGETDVFMDVTKFVRPVVENNTDNFGLMFIPVKHDLPVYHIPQGLISYFQNSAQVKIIYH